MLPTNTYPTQDDAANSYEGQRLSILDGDMGLDAEGNAYLAWIDNYEAWDWSQHSPRVRTTTVVSTTAAPQVTKHYYAAGGRIATRVDGALYYILGDHLGSTTLVADAQGDEVGHVIYDAYGQIVENTIPLTLTDRLFTGQVFDSYTELYLMGDRWYDPQIGQWTSPDPIIPDLYHPASLNHYSYVYNSPLVYIDEDGHFPIPLFLVLGGMVLLATASNPLPPDQQPPDWQGLLGLGLLFGGGAAAAVPELIGAGATAACADADCTNEAEIAARTICADGDCTNEAQVTARLTSKVTENGWTLIGKTEAVFDQGQKLGATIMDVPEEELARLTPEELWARNVQFLDEASARGDVFRLATPFARGWAEKGTFFKNELVYLLQKGYELQTLYGVVYCS